MTNTLKALHATSAEEQAEMLAAFRDGAPVLNTERLWPFFTMTPPSPELGPIWLPYAALASCIIVGLAPSPERTIALRRLLEARAAAHLAWEGERMQAERLRALDERARVEGGK